MVFSGLKKVIFVHGCFWHGHEGCRRAHHPRSNEEYWNKKLARNLRRDRDVLSKLESMGWGVLIIWECCVDDLELMIPTIRSFLGERIA
jgi:DNA mismatch endonuclease, patch repair protein